MFDWWPRWGDLGCCCGWPCCWDHEFDCGFMGWNDCEVFRCGSKGRCVAALPRREDVDEDEGVTGLPFFGVEAAEGVRAPLGAAAVVEVGVALFLTGVCGVPWKSLFRSSDRAGACAAPSPLPEMPDTLSLFTLASASTLPNFVGA